MVRAVEKVRERLLRTAAILERAGVPYSVVGGNAVAAWVTRVDEAAVRNTRDVDILIQRTDLDAVKAALESAGFIYHETFEVHMFLDGPNASPRDAVHLLFAGEKVRQDDLVPTPELSESERGEEYRVVSLVALLRMKLTSFRLKDQVHIQDMIEVGLIDASWLVRYPPELAARLQQVLNNPNG
jgi:hypothetical protein